MKGRMVGARGGGMPIDLGSVCYELDVISQRFVYRETSQTYSFAETKHSFEHWPFSILHTPCDYFQR